MIYGGSMGLAIVFSGLALAVSLCSLWLSYKAYKKDDSDLQLEGGAVVPTEATVAYPGMENANSRYDLKFELVNRGVRDELVRVVQLVWGSGQRDKTRLQDFIVKGKETQHKSLDYKRSYLENIVKIEVVDCKGNVYQRAVAPLPKIKNS